MKVRLVQRGLIAALGLALSGVMPASAHVGSRAQLYLAHVRLQPGAQGWTIQASLRDLDSGRPEPGFALQASGSRADGAMLDPVTLTDPRNVGDYEAVLPVHDGRWALTVHAEELPGGNAALPITRTWTVDVRPGQAVDVTASSGSGGGHRPAATVLSVLGLTGAAVFLVMGGTRFAHRRQTAVASR